MPRPDHDPARAKLSRVPTNPCPTNVVVPLTKDRTVLKGANRRSEGLGSTGGHIGIAWAGTCCRRISRYIWPAASPPNYGAAKTKKIAGDHDDGEYNSTYCNGVISQDSISGSGSLRRSHQLQRPTAWRSISPRPCAQA